MDIEKILFHERINDTGSLTFLEGERDIPFPIRRVYFIYGVKEGTRRGFHAHKRLQQYLICVSGACKVLLDDGRGKSVVELSNPAEGLYIAPGIWREMFDFSAGAVLVVLASEYYDEADYIRDYNSFIEYIESEEKEK